MKTQRLKEHFALMTTMVIGHSGIFSKNAAGNIASGRFATRPREHKKWNIHNVFYTLQTIHNVFYLACLRSSFVDESWRFAQLNSNERLYRIFCMNVVSS